MKLLHRVLIVLLLAPASCQNAKHSFSLASEEQSYQQSSVEVLQKKVDILWVVDNSASMTPYQQNLTANFSSFIQDFIQKNYDFHLAVTTTEAYLDGSFFRKDPRFSLWRDGGPILPATGFAVISKDSPDVLGSFTANALQGSSGSGDERPFASFKAALQNPANAGFLRPGSFLAIIILTDEDDFSDPTRAERTGANQQNNPDHDYSDPGLESVDSYLQFLDQWTGSHPEDRNYNVSAVAVLDSNCWNQHQAQGSIIGRRVMEMAEKTGGVLSDICSSNYSAALQQIQKRIIELSSEFVLNRRAVPSSIRVSVNGVAVPEDSQNGWTYEAAKQAVLFHGDSVPPKDADVSITYDPEEAL